VAEDKMEGDSTPRHNAVEDTEDIFADKSSLPTRTTKSFDQQTVLAVPHPIMKPIWITPKMSLAVNSSELDTCVSSNGDGYDWDKYPLTGTGVSPSKELYREEERRGLRSTGRPGVASDWS
jgi:hypothetical protein